jgi:hypothetical protein
VIVGIAAASCNRDIALESSAANMLQGSAGWHRGWAGSAAAGRGCGTGGAGGVTVVWAIISTEVWRFVWHR